MYQLMKKSFEEQKDYQTAGKFYVSEMVFRQKEATGIRKIFLFSLWNFCGIRGKYLADWIFARFVYSFLYSFICLFGKFFFF